jgi:hypothetical protein
MKVELEKGVWLADWEGDPGRTVVEANAQEFENMKEAIEAWLKLGHIDPSKMLLYRRILSK